MAKRGKRRAVRQKRFTLKNHGTLTMKVVPMAAATTLTVSVIGYGAASDHEEVAALAATSASLLPGVSNVTPSAEPSRSVPLSRSIQRVTPTPTPTPSATPTQQAQPEPKKPVVRDPEDVLRPVIADWLANCNIEPQEQTGENGQIPAEELCELPNGHQLRGDAAQAFWHLDTAYRQQFGEEMCMTDSYRSYEAQVALKAAKPTLAATPGTSNHGWGIAIDFCGGIETFDTEEHAWMTENAPEHGWVNPSWAQQGGSKPEAWHWEFEGVPAVDAE